MQVNTHFRNWVRWPLQSSLHGAVNGAIAGLIVGMAVGPVSWLLPTAIIGACVGFFAAAVSDQGIRPT